MYASNDTNPVTACPAGLRLGDGLGQFGHYGTAPLEEIAPLLPAAGKIGPSAKAAPILEAVAAAYKARAEA
ncbi:hypothetical protein [Streptacidiphilus rugosus]|uniref:hypothetical protein n=1 Tax=Streptacidiphilus rugosus TaxID=405783 RepID=UPI000569806A|nr:hypothetical protein [Streptacidiphilus rugosus]